MRRMLVLSVGWSPGRGVDARVDRWDMPGYNYPQRIAGADLSREQLAGLAEPLAILQVALDVLRGMATPSATAQETVAG